jgi:hypothetical protein
MKIQKYLPEIEVKMCNFYNSLSEKDRRRYAAIIVPKLGYGGARQLLCVIIVPFYMVNKIYN